MPCAPDMQGLNHRTTREVPWYPLKYRVSFPPCPQTPFPYLLPPDTGPHASQLSPSIHFSTYSSLSQYTTFTHLKYSPLLQLLFSHSVVCDSLRPHGLQYTRPPCPSPGHTQTHVHRVGDAIQSSHPLSSPSPPALNLSQHQSLFQ